MTDDELQTVFFEPGKAESSFLKVFPTNVQLLNGLLKDLRRDFTQSGKFLLRLGQVIKLLNFVGKLQFGREDILFLKGASIYQTLPTITPIFNLPKRVVVRASANFHPLNELLLLSSARIDSVTGSDSQHPSIRKNLLDAEQPLNVNLRGIEPLKLTSRSPCIPREDKNDTLASKRLYQDLRNLNV